jgi:CheY-like chemotaxis protein
LCVTELAEVIWGVQMSTVEFHPWNSRRADTEKPDEWRIDLDPMPECPFDTVRRVAHVAQEVLDELGAVGWPKTSGGKGMHIYVRIEPSHGFTDVRRAALAFAPAKSSVARPPMSRPHGGERTAIRRRCSSTTTKMRETTPWPRRTPFVACPTPVCRLPITWDEIDDVEPADLTIATVPARFAEVGDLHAGIDGAVFAIDSCSNGQNATSEQARSTSVIRRTPTSPSIAAWRERSSSLSTTTLRFRRQSPRDLRSRYGERYRIARSTSGAEALTALEEFARRDQAVALIVSDHRMPEMTGIELLHIPRRRHPARSWSCSRRTRHRRRHQGNQRHRSRPLPDEAMGAARGAAVPCRRRPAERLGRSATLIASTAFA